MAALGPPLAYLYLSHHGLAPDLVDQLGSYMAERRLKTSSGQGTLRAHLEAMSADIVLTPHARTGPVANHEPGL